MCTDGAHAMLRLRSGFLKLVKVKNPSIISSYSIVHRQDLAMKTRPSELKNVLEVCIKVVSTIKSSALYSRLFKNLCSEISAEHSVLLFHTDIHGLFKRNMFERLYKLKFEVKIVLLQLGKRQS